MRCPVNQQASEMAKNVMSPEQSSKEETVKRDTVQMAETRDDFDIMPWLKPETPPDLVERVTRIQHVFSYSGPLPPADELRRYEDVLSGTADRIVSLAERSLDFQQELMRENTTFAKRRLTASTVVSLSFIGASVVAIIFDPAWLSIPLGLGGIATLVLREFFGRNKD